MDCSLDEIIVKKGLNNRGRKPGSFRGAGRGRGFSGPRRGGAGAGRGRSMPSSGGGVPSGRWSHDMYQGGRSQFRPQPLMSSASSGPTKMLITNLDYGVTDSDIKELFREFGNMQMASVHYDNNGSSLGSAQVVYSNRNSAIQAKRQYNGVHLDRRPMVINIEGDQSSSGAATGRQQPMKRLGPVPTSQRGFGGGRGSAGGRGFSGGRGRGGRGRGRGAGGAPPAKEKTAEELDAELDKYLEEAKK